MIRPAGGAGGVNDAGLIEFREKARVKGEYPDDIFCYIRYIAAGKLINKDEQEQRQAVIVTVNPGPEEKIDLGPQPQEEPGKAINGKRFREYVRNDRIGRGVVIRTVKMLEYIYP